MGNSILTYGLIARRAVKVLENTLVMANQVYRGYEAEYSKNQNGYKTGDTITIRRPAEFVVNDGPVAVVQDATEGSTTIVVNQRKNTAMNFTSKDLTLDITDFSERFIEPAMISMAQYVDQYVASLASNVPNWVGTPGNALSNFDSFAAATQRLEDTAVPEAPARCAILSPRDARGLQSSLTGPASIFAPELVGQVYKEGILGRIDGVDTYKTQNAPILTTGSRTVTGGTLSGGSLYSTWLASKDTNTMVLTMTNIGANATLNVGDVFTLAGVYDVNPRSKFTLPYLKQFVVQSATAGQLSGVAVTADGSGNCTPTISPPIILSGAYQNVSNAPATNAAVTFLGAASSNFINNIVFNKNAFALVMVPLAKPEGGAAKVSRMSHKGINVRVLSWYDGINDNNLWRFDILFGAKTIDPRMATRLSGT